MRRRDRRPNEKEEHLSILRDDRLLALHDLVEACRASARHAELAAEMLSEDPRAAEMSALAAQRKQDAERFCEPILEAEDVPPGPPEERGLLETALASAKAAFAEDGGAALVEGCRAQEQKVLRCAEAAAAAPLRDEEKAVVERLVVDARGRLAGFPAA